MNNKENEILDKSIYDYKFFVRILSVYKFYGNLMKQLYTTLVPSDGEL